MKKHYYILGIEAVICAILAVVFQKTGFISYPLEIITMPIELIADGLRILSLSGSVGNILAVALYALICLSPVIYGVVNIRRNGFKPRHILLFVLSVVLFTMIYRFINPAMMLNLSYDGIGGSDFIPSYKFAYASVFYSVLIGYIAIGIVDKKELGFDTLPKILSFGASIYVIYVFYFYMFDLLAKFSAIQPNMYGLVNKNDYTILPILAACDLTPMLFSVSVMVNAIPLINNIRSNPYDNETLEMSEKISKLCKIMVISTVLCNIALNLVQLLMAPSLKNVNFNVNIPLIPLIVAVSFLCISRYISDTIVLKDENDRFI